MKAFLLSFALGVLWFGPGTAATAQTADATPLTNAAIVKLIKADFKEKTVIAIIESRPSRFDLSPEQMIELKKSGVSEKIILAMLAHQQGLAFDESWGDEGFFHQNNTDAAKRGSDPGNSTDIFGSNGSSRGNTQTRGSSGSASGDTATTGSATVRILRPPSEAGGAPPRLERVEALTNDSIVELIEAGFSEGTIIRRIEQSPVEFDLSPAKLADLRKRRVTEKILSAMKVASGETGDSKAS